MRKIIVLLVATAVSNGCGSFVPVVRLDDLPAERRHALSQLKVFNSVQLTQLKFEVLGIVEGNSCQNKLWDPPATRERAIEQAKYRALERGADGITNVQCGAREGTSLRTNCWELISCTAEAIQIAK